MSKRNLTLILIGLAVADLLGAIDSTGVNIALPTITRDLHIPIALAQWIPNAYTLVLVCMLIFMGKVGDMIGAKKLYIYGLILFGLTSLALGFINNTSGLIITRALQGLGTAILYTMPMAIIAHLWKEREKAFAVTASFFAGGMLVGPLIGGFFTGLELPWLHGWHLLFLLNVPFIIFGIIVAAKFIPKLPAKNPEKLDYLSLFLFFAGLILIVLALTIISKWFILAGLAAIIALYLYERKARNPLLDFDLFQNRTFLSANLLSFFAMVTIIGMSFVLTFYLQDVLHWSAMQAGLAFLPIPVVTGIFATLGGNIKNWRFGAFLTGSLILTGITLFAFVNPSISYFKLILPAMVLISAGSGILMSTMFAAILGSAPTEKSGMASGFLNTLQQLGALIGVAIVASLVLRYNLAFSILIFAALAGFIAALFIKNSVNLKEKVI
jgi:MFS family permease